MDDIINIKDLNLDNILLDEKSYGNVLFMMLHTKLLYILFLIN